MIEVDERITKAQAIDALKRIKDEDVTFFVRGGWLDEFMCSKCGKILGVYAEIIAYNYCPYCGRLRPKVAR